MKNIYIFSLLITFFSMSTSSANAYTGECLRPNGVKVITLDVGDLGVKTPTDDDIGHVVINNVAFSPSGRNFKAKCDIPEDEITNVYITTEVPLQSENNGWFVLNEYLSVKTETYIFGTREVYITNPFKSESNDYKEDNGNLIDWVTSNRSKISIRIDRKFVGFSAFNKLVVNGYANAYKTGTSKTPLYQIYLKGSVAVPQSCDLDAGTTITMDFGNIGAPLFSQAGAGNKPAGVNPQTHAIAVKCKNIDAQALLSMRLESDNVSGNAMVSDNKDVGFIVAGSDKVPLTPNNIDSKIKFQLDDNSAAMVPITAWPVSITGNKPAEGRFTSEGYLRIDFD